MVFSVVNNGDSVLYLPCYIWRLRWWTEWEIESTFHMFGFNYFITETLLFCF